MRFTASLISSALTVLRPAWVANSRASFPTRTATSSTTFRSSSAASSPILPAPPFFMSRCTAAFDVSVSANYESNKKVMADLVDAKTKRLRNRVVGYVTRLKIVEGRRAAAPTEIPQETEQE